MIPTEITFWQYQLLCVTFGLIMFGISGLFVYLDRTGVVSGIERYGYSLISRMSLAGLFLTLAFGLVPAPAGPMELGGSTSIWLVPLVAATTTYVLLPVFFGMSHGVVAAFEWSETA